MRMNDHKRSMQSKATLALAAFLGCAAVGAGVLLWRQGSAVPKSRRPVQLEREPSPTLPSPSLAQGAPLASTKPITMEELRIKAKTYAIEKLISPPVPDADNA